jgi:hypothetical protein
MPVRITPIILIARPRRPVPLDRHPQAPYATPGFQGPFGLWRVGPGRAVPSLAYLSETARRRPATDLSETDARCSLPR